MTVTRDGLSERLVWHNALQRRAALLRTRCRQLAVGLSYRVPTCSRACNLRTPLLFSPFPPLPSFDTNTSELKKIFTQFGKIDKISFLKDRHCAFIDFGRLEDSLMAFRAMQGVRVGDQVVELGFGQRDNAR